MNNLVGLLRDMIGKPFVQANARQSGLFAPLQAARDVGSQPAMVVSSRCDTHGDRVVSC